MSLEKCSSCSSEFLTEADPYIVRPTKDGLKLYCFCYIVGHNQFDHVDEIKKLEAKNGELEKHIEILSHQLKYAETILTEVQADKFKLRVNLEIVKDVLSHIYETSDDKDSSREAKQALAAINGEGGV